MTREFWKYYSDLKKARNYNDSLIKILINEKIQKIERMIEMNTTYLMLIERVKEDCPDLCGFCEYCKKLEWIIKRAKHYAQELSIPWEIILDEWEKERTYWYFGFYNDVNQPEIETEVKKRNVI
jgi:hypothetical protein